MNAIATRPRTLLAAPLLVVSLGLLAACGSSDTSSEPDATADTASPDTASPDTATPSSSDQPEGTTETGTVALTADGSVTAKCAMPSAETLATFDTAFSGTVTSVDGGTATLAVDRWYAGDGASTVTVESPSNDLQDLLMAVDFEEGRTYLVSADGTRVTLCGDTAEETPELEAMYAEAFAQ